MIKAVKIPQERVAVLIGRNGTEKKKIEKITNTEITIDEEIIISGSSLDVMTARNIVLAIGQGFSPQNAEELGEEDKSMEIIELPKNEQRRKRLAARIIGSNGKSRKNLELLTNTRISVYGKTVSIIGCYDNNERARRAIEMLIKGHSHKSVYKLLERM